jgi:hypothetical protein
MTLKKVQALPVGQSRPMARAPGRVPHPVYQADQTRSQWLEPHYHLSAATVMTTAYWMFHVFSIFSSSALAAAARRGDVAYQSQCVPGTVQVTGSSHGCQECPRGVQRVQVWSTERAVPVASLSAAGGRSAAGGARAALIGYPVIEKHQE